MSSAFRILAIGVCLARAGSLWAEEADLILQHGKIATVDRAFSVHEALAVKGDRILRAGSNEEVLKTKGPQTKLVDLQGRLVIPGLIDSHTHPASAAMTEFDHPIPEMESIADVLDYIRSRAVALGEGPWIVVRQVFITRLKEQRYPTKTELDAAAPKNPVLFSTGPDASVSSLALKLSGIDKNYQLTGSGIVERDSEGEPTGILRSCTGILKVKSSSRTASDEEQNQRLRKLFADYNSVGITGIIDRDSTPGAVHRYRKLLDEGALQVRIRVSQGVDTGGKIEEVQNRIREVAKDPLCQGGPMLRIIGTKVYLDGGMLTGSAYMLKPWGVSQIYSITDPRYRGLLYIPEERLTPMVQTAVENGLQFTAHSVGDGAVTALLDAYEKVNQTTPIEKTRPCLTHSNFMTREAVERAARLGVVVDIQPAWLYLDTRTLVSQFGYERLRYFQPLKSLFEAGVIVGGGSDHMQKIGSLRSVNPYNPFLGMWVEITRRAKGYEGQLHPEEALSREQALRFYTMNNAHLMFLEDRIGSLEPGKLADFAILDRDLLTCPVDEIKDARVLSTYLNGRQVYSRTE